MDDARNTNLDHMQQSRPKTKHGGNKGIQYFKTSEKEPRKMVEFNCEIDEDLMETIGQR
jgi:hypothetical protein